MIFCDITLEDEGAGKEEGEEEEEFVSFHIMSKIYFRKILFHAVESNPGQRNFKELFEKNLIISDLF